MKLWVVVQWGNAKDNDGNEADTQILIRANTLSEAVNLAQKCFIEYNAQFPQSHEYYLKGRMDAVFLIGNDKTRNQEPKVIIRVWIAHAFNYGEYDSWHMEHDTNKWLTCKEMYGDLK